MGNTTGGKRHSSGDSSAAMVPGTDYYGAPSRKAPLLVQPSMDDSAEFETGTFRGQLVDRMEPQGRFRAQSLSSGRPVAVEQDYQQKLPTVFKWEGGGKDVLVAGSFTNWKTKIPMAKSHGDFYTIIDLPEGEHQYKFYVDGQWQINPDEPTVPEENSNKKHVPAVDSEIGTLNNVVKVERSDFEVFEALEKDSVATGEQQPKRGSGPATGTAISGSPPGEYSQEVPVRKPNEKHSAPPLLPPHLLQVILNKDTPINCEPTLLPEPNHVMLNHLYALSIKDGVMVLSATHRYRKKYVTTLLYKPI